MDFLRIQKIDLYSYGISLVYPVVVDKHTIDERAGYIIKLTTDNGLYGFGDIAPLPGLHRETWGEIPDLIKEISISLMGCRLNLDVLLHGSEILEGNLPPTVRFGLESAILTLIDIGFKSAGQKSFFSDLVADVKINSLIDPSEGPVEKAVLKALACGLTCIKIKMGRQPLETDIKMIKRLYEIAGDSLTLRLDSNRSWSLPDAIKFCTEIPIRAIEYLEEPLREPAALEEFYKTLQLPLAVDESLAENDPATLLEKDWVHVAVVKPSVLGGIFRTIDLMRHATTLNKKVVISDTYHSGVGAAMLIRIAAIRREQMTAAGLDTYSRLQEDILLERLSFQSGRINQVDAYKKSRQLNFNSLIRHELY